jgi:RNA polymerase sigma factor for flagellar operon FliA
MVSFEGALAGGSGPGVTLEEVVEDPDAPLPNHGVEADERADGLKAALARLPEKERTVLALYYYEELNLRQIADVLQVTESRISQIRAQALRRLRDRLGNRERL